LWHSTSLSTAQPCGRSSSLSTTQPWAVWQHFVFETLGKIPWPLTQVFTSN